MHTSGLFTTTGTSDTISAHGKFNISLWGTWTGTVKLQRTFDGTNWVDVDEWTANYSGWVEEPEFGVQYRLNSTTFLSGTLNYRLGGN